MARSGRALDKRDIGANVNFFMNVPVTAEGGLRFADGISELQRHGLTVSIGASVVVQLG
jgi:uncharacterized protein YcgI (DUF1989 family)